MAIRSGPLSLSRALAAVTAAATVWAAAGAASAAPRGSVKVLYAGALTQIMEQTIDPAFRAATGYVVEGEPAGSQALVQQIASGQQRADVFISAAPKPDLVLMQHPAHGAITWYASFASSPLVIGYSPRSRFAAALRRGPWYKVMQEQGFRLGRTDPKLDPKGALTIAFMQAAAKYYHDPRLVSAVLGPVENPAQVFPEETLVARLQSGQLDAGFFYRNEAVAAHMPFLTLPPALTLGADFTIALPAGGRDPAGAIAFVKFLLGPRGRALLTRNGLLVHKPVVTGRGVPKALSAVV